MGPKSGPDTTRGSHPHIDDVESIDSWSMDVENIDAAHSTRNFMDASHWNKLLAPLEKTERADDRFDSHRMSFSPPNCKYLVPYRSTMFLYIKICPAVILPAFITATKVCKAVCDDGIRQRLKVTSVYSESSELGFQYSTQAVGKTTRS